MRHPPIRLRLVADDLTGALDTAAQFVGRTGQVPVFWNDVFWTAGSPEALPPNAAIDAGTREQGAGEAAAVAARLAPVLAPAPGVVAFRKLDSLLRGHPGAELAATLRRLPVRRCIVAPAFPFQGRVTRQGRQYARADGGWRCIGEDFSAALARHGQRVTLARPGDAVPEGISLWDAETDDDLARIAAAGQACGEDVLWCGSSGLAGALAGPQQPVPAELAPPVLGLFGSDHVVTAARSCAAGPHRLPLPDGGDASAASVARRLNEAGLALVCFALPPGVSRAEAASRIAREMDALTRRLPPPRTLVVAGGETLRALCLDLGAERLDVQGQILPGVPCAVLRGGRWDGVTVVSKSGAFGEERLLCRLLRLDAAHQEDIGA
jgi:uncharacterized protein YgbK (DUF1537 family)